jgi:hypothetical protein
MRQLQLKTTIAEDELDKLRRKSRSSTWIAAGLLLAAVWVVSGVSLSPSLVVFSSVKVDAVEHKPVTLTNRSIQTLRQSTIEVEGPDASDFQVSDPCKVVLSSHTCVLDVRFQASESGVKHAQLVVQTTEGKRLVSELLATALPGVVSVTPGTLNFGEVTVGGSAENSVVVSGETAFQINAFSVSQTDDYQATTQPCRDAKGFRDCTVSVQFQPKAEGPRTAELLISDNTSANPHHVRLTGTGSAPPTVQDNRPTDFTPPSLVPPPSQLQAHLQNAAPSSPPAPPEIQVDPNVLDFSTQAQQQVHLHNRGAGDLRIGNVTITGPNQDRFTVAKNECQREIGSGQLCIIVVKFSPKWFAPKSSYSAQLEITHNAPGANPRTVALQWSRTIVAQPHVSMTPDSLSFSPGETSKTFTIFNDGQVVLTQLNLRLGILNGGGNGPFHHSDNCHQLAIGARCVESVSFSPPVNATKNSYSEDLYVFEGLGQSAGVVNLKATVPPRTQTGVIQ